MNLAPMLIQRKTTHVSYQNWENILGFKIYPSKYGWDNNSDPLRVCTGEHV